MVIIFLTQVQYFMFSLLGSLVSLVTYEAHVIFRKYIVINNALLIAKVCIKYFADINVSNFKRLQKLEGFFAQKYFWIYIKHAFSILD